MDNFSKVLIDWYTVNKRDLPWRESKDPYLIWISEIILQQTRVNQGYNYFLRFIKRFPCVKVLADASDDEVMKYWQGLGYYSRARHLLQAARSMNGVFPETYNEVLALSGVGKYTAAAICSFAYDMPYAVLDGNVYRVLARYFGIDIPIDSTKGNKFFTELADKMLDKKQPAVYNQAIMDFGAIQCTPKSPGCSFCPFSESCAALSAEQVDFLPVKSHKTKVSDRYFYYMYVRAGDYTLLRKRSKNDIWKDLFEFPLIETSEAMSREDFMVSAQFCAFLGNFKEPVIRLVHSHVKHVLTHRIIHADFYEITVAENLIDIAAMLGYICIPVENIRQYAVPKLIDDFIGKEICLE